MKISLVLASLIGILTACGPIQPAVPPSFPSPSPPPTRVPPTSDEQASRVEAAVTSQLSENLGLGPGEVSVLSNERTEFHDACLGVDMPDVICAQALTPGRIIMLEAEGISYEYHLSEDGVRVQPASLALSWQREGGIAGFCDRLVVFRSGEVYGYQCASEGRMGTFASLLGPLERERFAGWVRRFGSVRIDASDPKGVADRMLVMLSFEGVGSGETVSASDEQALLRFAGSLYAKLSNQAMPQ